jgi:hypothetical protein
MLSLNPDVKIVGTMNNVGKKAAVRATDRCLLITLGAATHAQGEGDPIDCNQRGAATEA